MDPEDEDYYIAFIYLSAQIITGGPVLTLYTYTFQEISHFLGKNFRVIIKAVMGGHQNDP